MHQAVQTTMIYTDALDRGGRGAVLRDRSLKRAFDGGLGIVRTGQSA